jgi:hypothetical protein
MFLKSLTLRIEQNIYDKTKHLALKEKCSVNSLIEQLIIEKLKEKEKQTLFEEFSIVGLDQEISDVEYSIQAQKEVLFSEKP